MVHVDSRYLYNILNAFLKIIFSIFTHTVKKIVRSLKAGRTVLMFFLMINESAYSNINTKFAMRKLFHRESINDTFFLSIFLIKQFVEQKE